MRLGHFREAICQELVNKLPTKTCCKKAFLCALVASAATKPGGAQEGSLLLVVSRPQAARAIKILFSSVFGTRVSVRPSGSVRRAHELSLPAGSATDNALKELGLAIDVSSKVVASPSGVLRKKCCRTAFLGGLFLASGYIVDPARAYRLEFRVLDEKLARFTQELVQDFGISLKS